MTIEWFTPTEDTLEWFGETQNTLAIISSQGISAIASIVGVKGDKGDIGVPATITLGTIATGAAGSNVIITNSGTTAAVVLDITIPVGNTGSQGDQGLAFPTNSGLAAGKSTYDDGVIYSSYLDTENALLYFKLSGVSADWSAGVPFGIGATGDPGTDGTDGTDGNDGLDGDDGNDAGLNFTFSNSIVIEDPGIGIIRLNNATYVNITEIVIDDQSASIGNPDISADVNTWGDSTNTGNKGRLILKEAASPDIFHIFKVTALVNEAGYSKLTVVHLGGSGAFTNAGNVAIEFYRSGDGGGGTPWYYALKRTNSELIYTTGDGSYVDSDYDWSDIKTYGITFSIDASGNLIATA